MNRVRSMFGVLAALLTLAAMGTGVQGCSNSSARRVSDPTQANFRVDNRGPTTISVFVSTLKIGEVRSNELIHFDVGEGFKTIEFRETGGSVQDQGSWRFTDRGLLELKYRITTPDNFQVTNLEKENLHVLIDGVEVGLVTPGLTLPMSVPVGTREISLRLTSVPVATSWGTLRFAADNVVAVTFNQ